MKLTGFLFSLLASAVFAGETSEVLFFLKDDIKQAVQYTNIRYDSSGNKKMHFSANYDKSLISYARPGNYHWEKIKDNNVMVFPDTHSYAYLEKFDSLNKFGFKHSDAKNKYTIKVDGGQCLGDGCITDEMIISVAIPKRFKVLAHAAVDSNGKGLFGDNVNWKVVDGTYTLYAKNIVGGFALFDLEDISDSNDVYNDVSTTMSKYQGVTTEKNGNLVKVSMPIDDLFAPGSAEMKKTGLAWIKELSKSLKNSNYVEVRVEGHTDNTPIKTGKFASNWELSTGRSSSIVRYLIADGHSAEKLAAVGFGDSRPLVSNTSKEGKMKNRRIEFTIVAQEAPVTAAAN